METRWLQEGFKGDHVAILDDNDLGDGLLHANRQLLLEDLGPSGFAFPAAAP